MFRLSSYLHALHQPKPPAPHRGPAAAGPVVIWNLTRRCNLACRHCYATSADRDFPGELTTAEALTVLEDLKSVGVTMLILSGGEPLLRPDLLVLARQAKDLGLHLGLSSNGTLLEADQVAQVAATGFDYVGISLDGLPATHDRFRRQDQAFVRALAGIRRCRDAGLKVGVRFTLTRANAQELPDLLHLLEDEQVTRFYLSHLNYAGRGHRNRGDDAQHQLTRQALDLLFDTCWGDVQGGRQREFVTGNNDADGVYLLAWAARCVPQHLGSLREMLVRWGGNASGVHIANIDPLGFVHPDTFWWDYSLGNVRERPFSAIWQDPSDPLLAGLRRRPRPLEGRCAVCAHQDICGGNTRTRAYRLTGNPWAEDPGCYLTDTEIGRRTGESAPGIRA